MGAIPLRHNPAHPAAGPSAHDSPHPSLGRHPNRTGLVVSPLRGGPVFVGNGGVSDVSVIDLAASLAGEPDPELGRVAMETGPFGMAVSPDGALVAAAARESMSEPHEGRTVSIIDVARAAEGRRDAEIARLRVGDDVSWIASVSGTPASARGALSIDRLSFASTASTASPPSASRTQRTRAASSPTVGATATSIL